MKRLGLALLLLLVSQLALADGGVIQPGTNTTCSGGGVAAACNNFGTSAVATTGTSGHTIPFLDGANTWGASQTIGSSFNINFTTSGVQNILTAGANNFLNYDTANLQPRLVGSWEIGSFGGSIAGFGGTGLGGFALSPGAGGGAFTSEQSDFVIGAQTATLTGTFATERISRFDQPTLAGAFTITTAANASVGGPIIASGSTLVTDIGLWVQAGASVGAGATTAVGFQVDAPTGGGTNKTAVLNGTGIFTPGLTTGTNADFICMAAGGQLLIQGSACTISSLRFKHDVKPLAGSAIAEIAGLEPVSFVMNGENRDANAMRLQIGLTAENVAAVDDRLAVYEDDGVTPKSYRQEAVLALAVAAIKEQQRQIEALRAEVARLQR